MISTHLLGVRADDDIEHAFGMPARSASLPSQRRIRRQFEGGHDRQPTASAGEHFRVIMAFGKFQGVIAPTTPIGCLMTMMRTWRMMGDHVAVDALTFLGIPLDGTT